MAPDEEAQQSDCENREHHGAITKDRFARESREDVRRRTHTGQDRNVDLRVSEEPEQVLPENWRTTRVQREIRVCTREKSTDIETTRNEEARARGTIEEQQNPATEEHRE